MTTPTKRSYPVVEIWSASPHASSSKKARLTSPSLPPQASLPHQRAPTSSSKVKTEFPPTPPLDATSTPPHAAATTSDTKSGTNLDRKWPLPAPHWRVDLAQLESFFDFIYERHKAHLERVAKLASITTPSTMPAVVYKKSMSPKERAKYYVACNVYRELDAGTQDLLKQVVNHKDLQPVATDTSEEKYKKFEDAVFRTILYRMFNKPLTYTTLLSHLSSLSPPVPLSYSSFLSSRSSFNSAFDKMYKASSQRGGESLNTNQYMIIATTIKHRTDTIDWVAKLNILEDIMRGRYWDTNKKEWREGKSLSKVIWEKVVLGKSKDADGDSRKYKRGGKSEMLFEEIQKYDLFGKFLGYQLLLDFTYLPHLPLSFSLENDSWVSHGNGSKSGLGYIFTGKFLKDSEILEAMRYLNKIQDREWERIRLREEGSKKEVMRDSLPPVFSGSTREKIGMVDIEHALCELSKFHRGGEKMCQYLPKDRKIDFVLPRKIEIGYVEV